MELEKKAEILEKILKENDVYTEDLFWNVLGFVDDNFVRTDTFHCPECSAALQIHLTHRVKRIVAPNGEVIKTDQPKPSIEVVHPLADTALFHAFEDAWSKLPLAVRPKDLNGALLNLINNAQKISKLPPLTIRALMDEYGSPNVAAYGNGNMAVVVVDGEFRQFIPVPILKGLAVTALQLNGAEIAETKKSISSEVWIKTKFGYVAERGLFLDEMRKKSVGEFAK